MNLLFRNILILLMFSLVTKFSFGKVNSTDSLEAQYQKLLTMSSHAYLSHSLPNSCRYVTTDMYTAASAGKMILKSDMLLLVNRYKAFNNKRIPGEFSQNKNMQVDILQKERESLDSVIKISKQKLIVLRAARDTYKTAATYALNTFYRQKSLLDQCISNLRSAENDARGAMFCGDGCGDAVADTINLFLERERRDFTAMASTEKERLAHITQRTIEGKAERSCKKIGCLMPLRQAVDSCDKYKNRYWINLTYCNRDALSLAVLKKDKDFWNSLLKSAERLLFNEAIANNADSQWNDGLGLKVSNPQKNSEAALIRKEAAKFMDDWIAHPRGRALVFDALEQLADESVGALELVIGHLEKRRKALDDVITDMGEVPQQAILAELNLPADDKKCELPKCQTFQTVFSKVRGNDFKKMGNSFGDLAELIGSGASGLSASSLNKETLEKLSKISEKRELLDKASDLIASRVDGLQKKRNAYNQNFKRDVSKIKENMLLTTSKSLNQSNQNAKDLHSFLYGNKNLREDELKELFTAVKASDSKDFSDQDRVDRYNIEDRGEGEIMGSVTQNTDDSIEKTSSAQQDPEDSQGFEDRDYNYNFPKVAKRESLFHSISVKYMEVIYRGTLETNENLIPKTVSTQN